MNAFIHQGPNNCWEKYIYFFSCHYFERF